MHAGPCDKASLLNRFTVLRTTLQSSSPSTRRTLPARSAAAGVGWSCIVSGGISSRDQRDVWRLAPQSIKHACTRKLGYTSAGHLGLLRRATCHPALPVSALALVAPPPPSTPRPPPRQVTPCLCLASRSRIRVQMSPPNSAATAVIGVCPLTDLSLAVSQEAPRARRRLSAPPFRPRHRLSGRWRPPCPSRAPLPQPSVSPRLRPLWHLPPACPWRLPRRLPPAVPPWAPRRCARRDRRDRCGREAGLRDRARGPGPERAGRGIQ